MNPIVGQVDNGRFGHLAIAAYTGPVGIADRDGVLTVAFLLAAPPQISAKERMMMSETVDLDAAIVGQVGQLDGVERTVVRMSRSESDARMVTLTLS